ncbi:hypothetical protein ACHAXR_001044 [Thalassiosira sp. AJA248-18]
MVDANDRKMTPSMMQKELQQSGFDLCHPIHTSWYNNLIRDEGLVENGVLKTLPEPSAILEDEGGALYNALLIGNTKKIWPVFLKWLASKVEGKKKEDKRYTDEEALEQIISPFDTFVEESIPRALQRCYKGRSELNSCEIFWSNGNRQKVKFDELCVSADSDDASAVGGNHCCVDKENSCLVSMQRVATTTGCYWHDNDATKLCVHPEYGTWTAFRCVVVFETRDANPSIPPAPPLCPCPVTSDEIKMAKRVFDYALEMSSSDKDGGYGTTLDKSWNELCEYLHGTVCSGSKWDNVPDTMKPWIQLRDCFNAGRENWKYSQAQLLYHYTRDPEILRCSIMELQRIDG